MANKKKLNIKDVKQEEKDKYFNSTDEMAKVLDGSKMQFVLHKARKKTIIGAKNTGKSFPVELDKYRRFEQDPMASMVTFQKYSTGASKRQSRATNKVHIKIKQLGYKFKYDFELKNQAF